MSDTKCDFNTILKCNVDINYPADKTAFRRASADTKQQLATAAALELIRTAVGSGDDYRLGHHLGDLDAYVQAILDSMDKQA